MSEKFFCCSGPSGCGKLFIGEAPMKCPECGNTVFRQGLENLGFRAKQELAAHKRRQNNDMIRRQYALKPRRK